MDYDDLLQKYMLATQPAWPGQTDASTPMPQQARLAAPQPAAQPMQQPTLQQPAIQPGQLPQAQDTSMLSKIAPYVLPVIGGVLSAMHPAAARGVQGAGTMMAAGQKSERQRLQDMYKQASLAIQQARLEQGQNKDLKGGPGTQFLKRDAQGNLAPEYTVPSPEKYGANLGPILLGLHLSGSKKKVADLTEEEATNYYKLGSDYEAERAGKMTGARQEGKLQANINLIGSPYASRPPGGGAAGEGVYMDEAGMPKLNAEGQPIKTGTKANKVWPVSKDDYSAKEADEKAEAHARAVVQMKMMTDPKYQKMTAEQISKEIDKHKTSYKSTLTVRGVSKPAPAPTATKPPEGAVDTGKTSGGKPVYQLPNGNYWVE